MSFAPLWHELLLLSENVSLLPWLLESLFRLLPPWFCSQVCAANDSCTVIFQLLGDELCSWFRPVLRPLVLDNMLVVRFCFLQLLLLGAVSSSMVNDTLKLWWPSCFRRLLPLSCRMFLLACQCKYTFLLVSRMSFPSLLSYSAII